MFATFASWDVQGGPMDWELAQRQRAEMIRCNPHRTLPCILEQYVTLLHMHSAESVAGRA